MTLLFQSPSLGLLLLALPQIFRAQRVLFYRPYWLAKRDPSPHLLRLAGRLIRCVNRRAQTGEQDPEEAARMAHENNRASDVAMQDLTARVLQSASAQAFRELLGDSQFVRFYQIRLLPWLLYETQFYRWAQRRIASGEEIRIIPDSFDRDGLHRRFFVEPELHRWVPAAIRAALRFQDFLSDWAVRLLALPWLLMAGVPVAFIMQAAWRGGIRGGAAPIRADVVSPLIWGFSEGGVSRGVKTGLDDSYLLGGELSASRMAFYYSDWRFSRPERRQQEQRMSRAGIRWFDPSRLPLTVDFLRQTARLSARLAGGLLGRWSFWAEDLRITAASCALFHHLLKGNLFNLWVEYKVLLEPQDYASSHVVRTILAERLGRLTVGDHHGAPDGPAGFPIMRYTHIHRHGVWGEAFRRAHAGHWDHMQNVPIGAWRSDFVIAAQQEGRLRELQERYRRAFGGRRPLAVLLFPSLGGHIHRHRVREVIEGLRLLRDRPGDLTVVCRFRTPGLAEQYRAIGLEEVLRADPRITTDLDCFTSYEWFALADLVIVGTISTGLIEAAVAGKPAFTFDYRLLAEEVYASYGSDLVLKNRWDLRRAFEGIETGFRGFDCQWERLARDFSYFSDGQCLERYRRMILDAVEGRAAEEPALAEVARHG